MVTFGVLPALLKYHVTDCVKRAVELDRAGFDVLWEGDHFLPWYHTDGHAADAAIALATYLPSIKAKVGWMGCPCIRQQPVDVALRMSTMASLYPGRAILAVGIGEPMNEQAATGRWPPTKERMERLAESIELMRRLWNDKEFFHFKGKYFDTQGLIYDKPAKPIPIYVAASGKRMMAIAGKYGDGFITISRPSFIQDTLIPTFEESAKKAGKDPRKLEKCAWVAVSYHPDLEKAFKLARRFAGIILPEGYTTEFDPRTIEKGALSVPDETIKEVFIIATKPDDIISGVERYIKAGITHVILDETSPDPWITPKVYREEVIPYFKEQYGHD